MCRLQTAAPPGQQGATKPTTIIVNLPMSLLPHAFCCHSGPAIRCLLPAYLDYIHIYT
ncbi:unnamed protein product [Periconia digitata]|uniref:Uncharacterized protein n=1 Tax=Periconia digitata TaxID=1303443 RepID=A0A9W4UVQ5_9PLEO|nr:unnamed protein product [Periconia digitata]